MSDGSRHLSCVKVPGKKDKPSTSKMTTVQNGEANLLVPAAVPYDLLISLYNETFGKWSHSITSQTLDFIDFSMGKYQAGCASVVKVTCTDGSFHEDVGYSSVESSTKGAAIEGARINSVSNALYRILICFDKSIVEKMKQRSTIRSPAGFSPLLFDGFSQPMEEESLHSSKETVTSNDQPIIAVTETKIKQDSSTTSNHKVDVKSSAGSQNANKQLTPAENKPPSSLNASSSSKFAIVTGTPSTEKVQKSATVEIKPPVSSSSSAKPTSVTTGVLPNATSTSAASKPSATLSAQESEEERQRQERKRKQRAKQEEYQKQMRLKEMEAAKKH